MELRDCSRCATERRSLSKLCRDVFRLTWLTRRWSQPGLTLSVPLSRSTSFGPGWLSSVVRPLRHIYETTYCIRFHHRDSFVICIRCRLLGWVLPWLPWHAHRGCARHC